jgi:hypothetical protein
MTTAERINELKEAIIAHLKEKGPRDWLELKQKFEDIPISSFWRYVKWAKDFVEDVPPSQTDSQDLDAGATVSEDSEDTPSEFWEPRHLNALFRNLKQAQRFYALYEDALSLKRQSLDSNGKIKDPALFAKSILVRERLLSAELSLLDGLRAAEDTTRFYDTLIEAVERAAPEVQKKMMEALSRVRASKNEGNANS